MNGPPVRLHVQADLKPVKMYHHLYTRSGASYCLGISDFANISLLLNVLLRIKRCVVNTQYFNHGGKLFLFDSQENDNFFIHSQRSATTISNYSQVRNDHIKLLPNLNHLNHFRCPNMLFVYEQYSLILNIKMTLLKLFVSQQMFFILYRELSILCEFLDSTYIRVIIYVFCVSF